MSESDQVASLESALLARAQKLADEYLADAHKSREQMLADARQRLHSEEERETLASKAHGERIYQQRIQAAELNLRSELDRTRWTLINDVISELPKRLTELAKDESRYLALLLDWLGEGAQSIERDELVVQVNARDLKLLRADWKRHARKAAPDKQMELSEQTINTIGGVLISSKDGNIRFDNTFEGRTERLSEALQRAIADFLIPDSEVHRV